MYLDSNEETYGNRCAQVERFTRKSLVGRASASVFSDTVSKFIAHRARFNVLFKSGVRRGRAISSGTINSRAETEFVGMHRE